MRPLVRKRPCFHPELVVARFSVGVFQAGVKGGHVPEKLRGGGAKNSQMSCFHLIFLQDASFPLPAQTPTSLSRACRSRVQSQNPRRRGPLMVRCGYHGTLGLILKPRLASLGPVGYYNFGTRQGACGLIQLVFRRL